jgi:hypothetical protein
MRLFVMTTFLSEALTYDDRIPFDKTHTYFFVYLAFPTVFENYGRTGLQNV